MRNYLRKTRTEGEKVIKVAKFHWIRFLWVWCIILISIYVVYYLKANGYMDEGFILMHYKFSYAFLCLFVCMFAFYWIFVIMADKVILTNKRIVAKRGLLSKTILDLKLSEVESVYIDSKLFGTGTITINGNGGLSISVPGIKDIVEFERIVQETLNEMQEKTKITVSEVPVTPSVGVNNIDERIELLTKLKGLLDSGVISQEEFQMERDRVMNN